jgi:hypothetical protein
MFIFQIIILPCCKEITHLQDVGINQKWISLFFYQCNLLPCFHFIEPVYVKLDPSESFSSIQHQMNANSLLFSLT